MTVHPTWSPSPSGAQPAMARRSRIVIDKKEEDAAAQAASERRARVFKRAFAAAAISLAAFGGVEFYNYMTAPDPPLAPVVQENVDASRVAALPFAAPPIFSGNGQLLALGAQPMWNNNPFTVVNGQTGAPLVSLPTESPVSQLAWLGKGNDLVWTDVKGTLTAYDAAAKKVLWSTSLAGTQRVPGELLGWSNLSASPDGRFVAVGGYTGELYVLNAQTGERVDIQHLGSGGVQPTFLPSGDLAVASNDNLNLAKKEAGTWNRVDVLKEGAWSALRPTVHTRNANGAMPGISNDGQHVIVGTTNKVFCGYDMDATESTCPSADSVLASSPVISPNRKLTAYMESNSDLYVVDVENYHTRYHLDASDTNAFYFFSPDSASLFIVDKYDRRDRTATRIRTFDAGTGDALLEEQLPGIVQGTPLLSPNGKQIGLVTRAGANDPRLTLYVADVTQKRPALAYPLGTTNTPYLQFTPDGKHLAVMADGASPSAKASLYLIAMPHASATP